MIHQVVSVFDVALESYARPFFVPTVGAAVRSFTDEVNRVSPDNPLNVHPDDFALFLLATFDDERGAFVMLDQPKKLIGAGVLKR